MTPRDPVTGRFVRAAAVAEPPASDDGHQSWMETETIKTPSLTFAAGTSVVVAALVLAFVVLLVIRHH